MKEAGRKGYIPMSLGFNIEYIASHWQSVEEGAKEAGRTPNRNDWHITRDVFVARTDEEALELSLNSMMGRQHREYWIPLFKELRGIDLFKHDPSLSDDEVTAEYMACHSWIVGSPETVAKKLKDLYNAVGGFGTLLVTGYDYADHPDAWKESMRLLIEEVVPRLQVQLAKV